MAGIIIKKKEGEPVTSLVYRFTKKVQQSGVLREAKKRRFSHRRVTRNKRHISALYKLEKTSKLIREKKLGIV